MAEEPVVGEVVARAKERWRSLALIFGKRKARCVQAQFRLTQAYRRVFSGKPSPEDQSIVLADLAARSGFYRVTHHAVDASALRQQEGMRELFAHISRHLTLAPEDVSSLENAARVEWLAENPEEF